MAQFKDSVQMRSYAQIDPVVAYQTDSFTLFNQMIKYDWLSSYQKFLIIKSLQNETETHDESCWKTFGHLTVLAVYHEVAKNHTRVFLAMSMWLRKNHG